MTGHQGAIVAKILPTTRIMALDHGIEYQEMILGARVDFVKNANKRYFLNFQCVLNVIKLLSRLRMYQFWLKTFRSLTVNSIAIYQSYGVKLV